MRFVNQTDGEEQNQEETARDVLASVEELERLLREAVGFREKLEAGTLAEGDSYLTFAGVLEHGYDRTGPAYVKAA